MNEREIRRTWEIFNPENNPIEVRIICSNNNNYSAYFKNVENLIKELPRYESQGNVYFTFNKLKEACYHREQQEVFVFKPKSTTADKDIQTREWLFIDVDPDRIANISCSNEEKAEAKKVAFTIYQFLKDAGFSEPVTCDSGNGFHLMYKIALLPTPENKAIIEKFLSVLDVYASTESAKVDVKVANEARITKLYGTTSKKGANSIDRPHRESRIVRVPDSIDVVPIELIKIIADRIPEQEKPTYQNNYNSNKFDLKSFISRNGIDVSKEIESGSYTKYMLSTCVFDSSHSGCCASLFENSNNVIGYNCFHNSCNGKNWFDVVRKFEPSNPILFGKKIQRSYRKEDQEKAPAIPQQIEEQKGVKFYRMSDIERVDRRGIVTIPSGIHQLDKKIIGFNKGEMTVWSGNNGSGKSTVLSQMCLSAATNGFKGIIYSGELKPQRVKDWLQLQAAGRQYVKEGKFEGTYYVPQIQADTIDIWLKDYLWIYNNKYGNTYTQLLADMEEHIKDKKVDYLILDNLMSLDLDFNDFSQNDKQKRFIVSLANFASEYNIHIHLVAHPRKVTGFLRKTDISGSADLTNRPDNVMIVHRVNNDFERSAKDFFGQNLATSMSVEFNNVIEICKNRDLGYMDELVGMYYEKESKRFLNTRFENPIYGWQTIETQPTLDDSQFNGYMPIKNNEDFLNNSINTELPF